MSDTINGDDDKRPKRPGRRERMKAAGNAGKPPARGTGPGKGRQRRDDEGGSRPQRAGAAEAKGGRSDRSSEAKPKSFRPRGEGAPGREPRSDKPFRSRGESRDDKGAKPFRPRAGDGAGPNDRPFRKRPEKAEAGDAGADRKSFKPRSHGMLSHGGVTASGDKPARPKSYGRLSHDQVEGERRPRPERSDRPRAARPREAAGEGAAAAGGSSMRIARRLARAGIASRRDAEAMIAEGRVAVNGKVIESPALDVAGSDRIEVDGAALAPIERTRLWLFHKPQGVVTTNRDPEGRPTVFDRLPAEMPRVMSIGRLDINTEGLLLLTNDGGLARLLELPSTGWLRRYRVRAHGAVRQEQLDELRQGIAVDGVFYGAIEASLDREQGANVWLTIGLREGKNREVKRILGHLGLEVNRLIRLSFGPFQLGDLAEGAVQEIKGRTLRDQLGERLIEESGADFDAPVVKAFSNKPVEAERSEASAKPKRRGDWVSATGERPNRKRVREARRDDALDRLDTRAARPSAAERPERSERPRRERPEAGAPRPERGGAPFGKKPRGDERGADAPASAPKKPMGGRRSANVWMAPGARPVGEKKAASRERTAGPREHAGDASRPARPRKRPEGGEGAPRRPRPDDRTKR